MDPMILADKLAALESEESQEVIDSDIISDDDDYLM